MNDALKSFLEGLDSLAQDCESRKGQACSLKELDELRIEFLGRKGKLAQAMGQLGRLDATEKPAGGKKANEVKQCITALLDAWQADLSQAESGRALSQIRPHHAGPQTLGRFAAPRDPGHGRDMRRADRARVRARGRA